jgi:hypothetical protein
MEQKRNSVLTSNRIIFPNGSRDSHVDVSENRLLNTTIYVNMQCGTAATGSMYGLIRLDEIIAAAAAISKG